ncbi:hypothetical protein NQ314_003133 [Rhamnusium bicolor]|uniref:Uncharacterized protein n=1 Tax=Rhamnusium bicolor TaxID=1586634 RepID=A0AAV8ZPV3_9CUCU|nr:hypothetical protein NQ314_003133 [Rhamnusium bicolor]
MITEQKKIYDHKTKYGII